MQPTVRFLLNDSTVSTAVPPGTVLADFLREEARLTGTKIGCREGDCGACTVLVGSLEATEDGGDPRLVYRNVNSCLMPVGNAAGCHVVTIEGVDLGRPNAVQQAFVEEGATQCGFCTPGFIMSVVGACMEQEPCTDPRVPISGNICRCTGYKSIERAVERVQDAVASHDRDPVEAGVLPVAYADVRERLLELEAVAPVDPDGALPVGGGTDLFVQRPEEMEQAPARFNLLRLELRGITREGDSIVLGASVTMGEVERSPLLLGIFPDLVEIMGRIGSQPIRNVATLSGNLANASPIGDMTMFFLALDSTLELGVAHGGPGRRVRLRDFFLDYKVTDLRPGEEIRRISFEAPRPGDVFRFEKVSKRTYLDIASVNTAMGYRVREGVIEFAHVAAGGVAPVPLYLAATSSFLAGQPLGAETVRAAARVMDGEIAPISDARGSAAYKRLLLQKLFFAHFLEGSPQDVTWENLVAGGAR